jgi:putative acetyltransferase
VSNVVVEIRNETPDDYQTVRSVLTRTMGSEVADLVQLLRNRDKAIIALVAELNGVVVGHIMFSPITVPNAPEDFRGLGLAPLAVVEEFQNKGIGSKLSRAGLEACRQRRFDAVVVLGHVNYYPRFGFSRAKDHGLNNEYNANDAFMVMELKPGVLHRISGLVKYAPEFREAGL